MQEWRCMKKDNHGSLYSFSSFQRFLYQSYLFNGKALLLGVALAAMQFSKDNPMPLFVKPHSTSSATLAAMHYVRPSLSIIPFLYFSFIVTKFKCPDSNPIPIDLI